MKLNPIFLALSLVLFACGPVLGVQVSISKEGRDAVLSWPSSPGDRFLIQQRPDFDTNTLWTTLTNLYPAAGSTNVTTFRLVGVFPAANTNISPTGGGSGGPPGVPASLVQRRPGVPALPSLPPVPWDPSSWSKPASGLSSLGRIQPLNAGPTSLSNAVTMGFYRVLGVPDFRNDFGGATVGGLLFLTMRFPEMEDRVDLVELLVNGEPTTHTERHRQGTGPDYYTGVLFYSDRLTNGNYTLQLRSVLNLADGRLHSPFAELMGKPVSVTINNEVSFADWSTILVGTGVVFEAQSVATVAAWTLDIYDAWGQWVKGATGETVNGRIQAQWDLRDASGNLRNTLETDPRFYAELVVQPLAGSGGHPTGPPQTNYPPVVSNDFPDKGGWTVAYQDREQRTAGGLESPQFRMRSMATNIFSAPFLVDFPSQLIFLPFAGTNQAEMSNQAPRDAAWGLLKTNGLRNPFSRNFYYSGHGGPSWIGGDWDNPATLGAVFNPAGSSAEVTSQWVRDNVTFNKYGANRLRFVFLDACETAVGDWPEAFGIPKQTNDLIYYENLAANSKTRPQSRPSAFVGWGVVIGGGSEWGTVEKWANFRNWWIGHWANGAGFPQLDWALDYGRSVSDWIPYIKFKNSIRVYGYKDLKFREFNRKGEWPPTP